MMAALQAGVGTGAQRRQATMRYRRDVPGRLVLWDVDHTLINAGRAGWRVYQLAFGEMFGRDVPAMKDFGKEPLVTSGFYMTINPEAFMPLDQFCARVDRLVRHIKTSETAGETKEILVAGQLEFRRKAERLRDGIPLTDVVVRELEGLARDYHVPFELF